MKKQLLLVLACSALSATVSAVEYKAPAFQYWNEEQVRACDKECSKAITLTLPTRAIARSLAYLGSYLCQELIRTGALSRMQEVPVLAKYQLAFVQLENQASTHSDFSHKSVQAAAAVVKFRKDNAELFESLLDRDHTREISKKLLRLHAELESRI